MDRQAYWATLLQEARAARWQDGLDRPASDWSLLNIVTTRTQSDVDPAFDADWTRAMTSIHEDITRPEPSLGETTELLVESDVKRERLEQIDACLQEFAKIDAKTGSAKMYAVALRYFDELSWSKIAEVSKSTEGDVKEGVQLCLQWVQMKVGGI